MLRDALWRQLGAAIDMLDDAVRECPDELWTAELWEDRSMPGFSAFWYLASHALFWLDYRISGSSDEFAPPAPFGLEELDPAGVLPPRPYTRAELLDYAAHCRRKCRATIMGVQDEQLERPSRVGSGELPFGELLLYHMRHVQEHAAQLNMFLGQRTGSAAGWVGVARD